MKKQNKQLKNSLKDFINGELSLHQKKEFVKNVCDACDFSPATWYLKLRQPHRFSKLEKAAIAKVAGKSEKFLFN